MYDFTYDFTAPLIAFFVLAGVASTVAVTVLVGVVGDLLAARTRVVAPVSIAPAREECRAA